MGTLPSATTLPRGIDNRQRRDSNLQLLKLVYLFTKKFLAFKRKGGFRRLPPMPEVNIDECTDIEQYYAEQRARNFARRFYRERGLPN
jgi:hypothetical protein